MRYRDIICESFDEWFAGSKVVDEAGRPKRMYHGTGAGDIEAFRINKTDATALYGPGFYFTDHPGVAGTIGDIRDEDEYHKAVQDSQVGYAFARPRYELPNYDHAQMRELVINKSRAASGHDRQVAWGTAMDMIQKGRDVFRRWLAGERMDGYNDAPPWLVRELGIERQPLHAPTVIPVYLSIKNPAEMDAPVEMWLAQWLADEGKFEPFGDAAYEYDAKIKRGEVTLDYLYRQIVLWNYGNRMIKMTLNDVLVAAGFDGIHHQGGNNIGTLGHHDVWIAFRPEQVKSIFAKSFNPRSPYISEGAPKTDDGLYWSNDWMKFMVGYWYNPSTQKSFTVTWGLDTSGEHDGDVHGDVVLRHMSEFGLPDDVVASLSEGAFSNDLCAAAMAAGWVRMTVWGETSLLDTITARNLREAQAGLKWAMTKHPRIDSAEIQIITPRGTNVIEHGYDAGKLTKLSGKSFELFLSRGVVRPVKEAVVVESGPTGRTLYHGTIKAHLPGILRVGLTPTLGEFTRNAYREYEENGEELPELVFATDKTRIGPVVSAIMGQMHHAGLKMTAKNFVENGAIVVLRDKAGEFRQREEDDYDDHPLTVEPGDYYTDDTVAIDGVLTGKKLVAFLRRHGARLQIGGDKTLARRIILADLVRRAMKAGEPARDALQRLKAMDFGKLSTLWDSARWRDEFGEDMPDFDRLVRESEGDDEVHEITSRQQFVGLINRTEYGVLRAYLDDGGALWAWDAYKMTHPDVFENEGIDGLPLHLSRHAIEIRLHGMEAPGPEYTAALRQVQASPIIQRIYNGDLPPIYSDDEGQYPQVRLDQDEEEDEL